MREAVEAFDAIEAGVLAARALVPGASGRVAAVFDRSLYIVVGEQWICIGPAGLGAGPLNLRCELPAGFDVRAGDFRVGDPVRIGDGMIRVGGRWSVRFAGAPVWTPSPPGAWTVESLRAALRALDRVVDGLVPEEGLGRLIGETGCGTRLPPVAAAAFAPLAALRRWVGLDGSPVWPERGSQVDRLWPSYGPVLTGLIGLGPGLTPSGDDALGGALIALDMAGRDGQRKALWMALEPALAAATNDVSIAHLRAASMGYGSGALHEVLAALLTGAVDNLPAGLDALGRIGHTSGWDALAGAAAALRGVAAERERI